MDTATPRYSRLVIESLFGDDSLTVDIPFRLTERVTILHGRNGSGKTITLQLLHALQEGRYEALLAYPFKRLELSLTDGSSLSVEQVAPEPQWDLPPSRLEFTYSNPDGGKERWETIDITLSEEIEVSFELDEEALSLSTQEFHKLINSQKRLQNSNKQMVMRTNKLMWPMYKNAATTVYGIWEEGKEPSALKKFRERLPIVKLITTERLLTPIELTAPRSSHATQPQRMVQSISEAIRMLVVSADRKYRRISTQLDGSLASRLFSPTEPLPLEELKQRYRQLNEQEQRFVSLGLLAEPSQKVDEKDMNEANRNILHTILMDREKKLQPFDEVVNKAQRLITSLNRKLAPKSVKLNVDTGYQIFTASQQPLPLEMLSSGEQHELVLLHELLFDAKQGSLILIDEPELSLHITWQEEFVPDLMAIAELAGLDFLLATHSPYIVGDYEHLMVRQGAPAEGAPAE